MRYLAFLLGPVLWTSIAAADAVRYDQIPADAVGYFYGDADRIYNSKLFRQFGDPDQITKGMAEIFGGRISAFTIYILSNPVSMDRGAMLLQGTEPSVRQKLEPLAAKAPDAIKFSYGGQDIYYSSAPPAFVPPYDRGAKIPSTQPMGPHGGQFSLGLGVESVHNLIMGGPSYTAFVGQDTVVFTADFPCMAHALDVLSGKQPSLAKQDPKNLKFDAPPGAFAIGAGLRANLETDNSRERLADGESSKNNPSNAGNFGLDFFGSIHGKAQLGHFDVGEDDHSVYIDASISMVDADSATQLKNLISGVKAMVILSQAKQEPLITPLEISAKDKDVVLRWSWPTAKLSELAHLTRDEGDDATNVPAIQPAERH